MASERNIETQEAVKREIKAIQERCRNAWNIIDNSPLEAPTVSQEEIRDKTLRYIDGVRTEIENLNVTITTDDNLLTSQFLKELKDKTSQVEELTAYMRGSVHDTDAEITRLNTLIQIAQETKSRPKLNTQDVKPEHIHKAKERFQMMKTELHGLIHLLFPNSDSAVIDIMGQLMSEHLKETASGYIPVTSENLQIIGLLRDMKIVTTNPYNNMEVKLAY